jgi:protein involved in polysaccharide export with SLBB domain
MGNAFTFDIRQAPPWRVRVKSSWLNLASILVVAALPLRTTDLAAQRADTIGVEARRSMVTRDELKAGLVEIQRGLTSTVYSQSLRSAKQAEAKAIEDRLTEGDLRSGDEIKVEVIGISGLSATYTVTPARTIVLPGNFEIPVRGVLRSEIQQYLTRMLKESNYVVDPNIHAEASVRISIFGGVGHPGFVNVPANKLLSAVLQTEGGGVNNNFKDDKSQIKRNGVVVIDGPEFKDALYKGKTLDQLNVQAGDEINVAVKPASGLFWRVVGAVSGLGGLVWLIIQVTRG